MGRVESLTSGNPGVNAIAKGEFDVLLCTDLSRLTRRLSPEIMKAIREAGVRLVTADGASMGMAELIANTVVKQSAKTVVAEKSERIKPGIRAARDRRKNAADAGSGSE